uniref:Uncharacterized protein n=1 Tax=Anguilla anguilla TaxID=7936 RepID=A0A0E9R679_ANGAN
MFSLYILGTSSHLQGFESNNSDVDRWK